MKAAVCLSDSVFPTHCRWTMSQRMPVGRIMEDVHTSACEHHLATHVRALQGQYFVMMDRHVTHLHQHTYCLQQGTHWPGYHLIPLNCGMSPCLYQMCIMPLRSISTGEIRKYTTQTHFLISSGMVMGYEFKLNPFSLCACNVSLPLPLPPQGNF
jgi:hypothetical protein